MSANITIVTFNRLELTRICLGSLLERTRGDFTVQVVDNASTDGTPAFLAGLAERDARLRVRLLARNMGVAVAANTGWAARPEADYYVKLDNDVEILRPDWLTELIGTAARNPEVGMAGYRLFERHRPERVALPSGDAFGAFGACGGGCALVPRAVHERLGFWTEDYGSYGFEDLDYSLRVHSLGLMTGYVDREDMVRHLGFERAVSETYERDKIACAERGKKLYWINRLLFEHRIRPLFVKRRYLPRDDASPLYFRLNPEYSAVRQLLRLARDKIECSADGDVVRLDMRGLMEPRQGGTG